MHQQFKHLKVEFDGGTRSNIPPYGNGYGSYRITEKWNGEYREGQIRRMEWGPMSCNAGEIRTVVEALLEITESLLPVLDRTRLVIYGDSQIAINRITKAKLTGGVPSFADSNSPEMVKWTRELYRLLPPFGQVKAQWHDRSNSVRIFGH